MAKLDDLKIKFKAKNDKRVVKPADDYHPIFEQISTLVLGEEIHDDVWTIIKVHNGWIVKRVNFGVVFVPEK